MFRTLCALACLLPACAADITGQWTATLHSGGRTAPLHFEWKQTPRAVTGAFGFRSDFVSPVTDPRLDSDKLTFTLQTPGGGPEATFEGTINTDRITGKLTSKSPALTGTLEMKRTGPPARVPSPLKLDNAASLTSRSDEFDSPASLKRWKTLSEAEQLPNRIDRAEVSRGQLTIVPKSAAWWAGYHGVFLFQEITGDFVLTTRLKVAGKSGGEPANIWTISGLLLRAPGQTATPIDQRKENWVYLMTGRGPKASRVVDAKSTRDNNNAWDITTAQPGWYELRIARVGPLFLLFVRPDGEDWSFRKLILREDLPATLQAGINVTSDFKLSASMPPAKYNTEMFDGQSDIDAVTEVDWIRFTPVPARVPKALAGKPLLDLSDEVMLAAFR